MDDDRQTLTLNSTLLKETHFSTSEESKKVKVQTDCRQNFYLLPFTFTLFPAGFDLALKADGFLIVGINLHGGARVGHGLRAIISFEEDAP